jgi:MYND finger/Activator of Hsp90 ATPase, N-terminal
MVDYSKFDEVSGGSSSEEGTDLNKKKTKVATPEVFPCGNCSKIPANPLRCGVCKSKHYCSGECQKEDWKFHKRVCKEPKQKDSSTTDKAKDDKTKSDPLDRSKTVKKPSPIKGKPEIVKDDSEKVEWYRHREWKPDQKQEFVPKKIDEPETIAPTTSTSSTIGKSVWNAADTWEERDMTSFGKSWIKDNFEKATSINGDASLPLIRGKIRFLFDFEFECNFNGKTWKVVEFSDSDENPGIKTSGKIEDVAEFRLYVNGKRKDFIDALTKNTK